MRWAVWIATIVATLLVTFPWWSKFLFS